MILAVCCQLKQLKKQPVCGLVAQWIEHCTVLQGHGFEVFFRLPFQLLIKEDSILKSSIWSVSQRRILFFNVPTCLQHPGEALLRAPHPVMLKASNRLWRGLHARNGLLKDYVSPVYMVSLWLIKIKVRQTLYIWRAPKQHA